MKWEESEMRFPTEWLRFASAAALVLGGVMSAQAQEIKLWTLNFANDSANQAFQSIIKQFQDANPGVTVKVENRGVDEHKSALRVAAGSDQGPDIFFSWAGLGLGGEFVKSGLALPMDKYYAEYKWDDRFLPVALSFSKQYPGGQFGIPYTFHGEAIYYNKSLFQKAGIMAEPKTYDELVAAADKLAKAGIPAFTFGGTVNWHVMRLMDEILETECGAEKHDALMTMKANWAEEPCATKAFDELHRWTSKYFLKPFMGIDQSQSFNLFLAGRAAMMLEGDWLVGQLKGANRLADFAVFPFPTGGNGSMASPSTTTSARRARIRMSRQNSWTTWSRLPSSRRISAISARSRSTRTSSIPAPSRSKSHGAASLAAMTARS
jgi:raffinose/stachyose/melibiose transport system substrate-binding protein